MKRVLGSSGENVGGSKAEERKSEERKAEGGYLAAKMDGCPLLM